MERRFVIRSMKFLFITLHDGTGESFFCSSPSNLTQNK